MNKDRDAKDIVGEQHAFLDHAKDFNWTEVMRILDINPHFVNVTPGGRWSALHQAAHSRNNQAYRALRERGADEDLANEDGETPKQLRKRMKMEHESQVRSSSATCGTPTPTDEDEARLQRLLAAANSAEVKTAPAPAERSEGLDAIRVFGGVLKWLARFRDNQEGAPLTSLLATSEVQVYCDESAPDVSAMVRVPLLGMTPATPDPQETHGHRAKVKYVYHGTEAELLPRMLASRMLVRGHRTGSAGGRYGVFAAMRLAKAREYSDEMIIDAFKVSFVLSIAPERLCTTDHKGKEQFIAKETWFTMTHLLIFFEASGAIAGTTSIQGAIAGTTIPLPPGPIQKWGFMETWDPPPSEFYTWYRQGIQNCSGKKCVYRTTALRTHCCRKCLKTDGASHDDACAHIKSLLGGSR